MSLVSSAGIFTGTEKISEKKTACPNFYGLATCIFREKVIGVVAALRPHSNRNTKTSYAIEVLSCSCSADGIFSRL